MSDLRPYSAPHFAAGMNLDEAPAQLAATAFGVRTNHRTRTISVPGNASLSAERPLGIPIDSLVEATAPAGPEILAAHYVRKSYRKGNLHIPVLQGVQLAIQQGEFVSIIGPSGCGKSTLLHLLATLDAPDDGEICFDGHRIDHLPTAGRDILRNRYFGMVFQFYHLLPELTMLENVLVPAMIGQSVFGYLARRRQFQQRAKELLELVGLGHRMKHKPRELSGGEMQRTAIARALVAGPRVLLADEPTGNLDKSSGEEILGILRQLNREQNLTIVMVTHDSRIAAQADRTVTLVDGRVVAA
jgi:lipoprotein-releasing system ATP-binding protein